MVARDSNHQFTVINKYNNIYYKGEILITKETIEERKSAIVDDVETVKTRLVELEKRREADTALLNALMGALQQCDAFLKEFDDELSDDGNETSDTE